jgi:hypothetical protein
MEEILAWKGHAFEHSVFDNPNAPYAGFFSSRRDVADRFAQGYAESHGVEEGVVHEVLLYMKNPVIIDGIDKYAADLQFGRLGETFQNAFNNPVCDGVILVNTRDEGDVYIPRKSNQIRIVGIYNSQAIPVLCPVVKR